MANFRFELNSRPSRNGIYTIFLAVTINGKRSKTKMPIGVRNKNHFNYKAKNNKWISSKELNYAKYNNILSIEMERAMNNYRKLKEEGNVTSQKVIKSLENIVSEISFINFSEKYIQQVYESGEINTYKKYVTFLNKLKFFINGRKAEEIIKYKGEGLREELNKMNRDLLFSEIDLLFLNNFKSFLEKQPNTRNPKTKLHPNTISKQFDQFASLYNKGIEEIGELNKKIKRNPFDNFSCKTETTYKEKLTEQEIRAINELNLEENSLIWHCRNYFMFSFYCGGMRAGDLIQLRHENIKNQRLEYKTEKNGKIKSILLLPPSLDILKYYMDIENPIKGDYIFPLLKNNAPYSFLITKTEKENLSPLLKKKITEEVNRKNTLINKYLKKIAEKANINKKITMHIARHSFTDIARKKNINVYDISKILGHSSIKITENYMSALDIESQDKAMENILNF